jgi:DNA-binding response OmpR family regulator
MGELRSHAVARRDDDRATERETTSPAPRGSVKVVPAADRRQRARVPEPKAGDRRAAGADSPASRPRGDRRRKPAAQPQPASRGRASRATDHIRGPLAGPIQLGDFTVDGAQLMVTWKGRASWFTPAEWRLLCVLLRNPGTVLSREELAEHAWDVVDPDRRSTVDVYVSRIRRKLNPEGGRSDGRGGPQLIQTVRHRGYRLVAEAAGEVSNDSEDSAAG